MAGYSSNTKHHESDCKVHIMAKLTNAASRSSSERLTLKNTGNFTHKFDSDAYMSVQEYHMDAKEGATFSIDFKTKSRFPAGCPKGAIIEILIDGIRQRALVSEANGVPMYSVIEGRRVGRNQIRNFKFTPLKVEDFEGNYKVPDELLKRGPNWIDVKKEVGQIRVNFYEIYDIKKADRPYEGEPDYEPCATVDQIGHIKLGEQVKCVTSLAKARTCKQVNCYICNWSDYPFHSIVIKYGVERPTANQLPSSKDPKDSAFAPVGKRSKSKWRRSLKKTLGRVLCFGESAPPAYDDLSNNEEIPPYNELDEKV